MEESTEGSDCRVRISGLGRDLDNYSQLEGLGEGVGRLVAHPTLPPGGSTASVQLQPRLSLLTLRPQEVLDGPWWSPAMNFSQLGSISWMQSGWV